MSAVQLNFYSNADTSITDMQNTLDGVFIGHHHVSLTNYDNTSLPAIAIGSKVENNGTMFSFTAETAISGSPSDGSVYIMLVPSGDPSLGTATVTPTFTNTDPVWSDEKQGYYGTSGSSNYRYLDFKIIKTGSEYLKYGKKLKYYKFKIGSWDMDTTGTKNFVIPLTITQIQFVSVIIYQDVISTIGAMFDLYVGGYWTYTPSTSTFRLIRYSSEVFDSTEFDDSSINRGYVNIAYEG